MEELIKLKNEIKENPSKVYELSYAQLIALNELVDTNIQKLDEDLKMKKQNILKMKNQYEKLLK